MKALVVSATPEPQSFTASMAQTSCRVLAEEGYQVTHSDLYAMDWNPVASAADFGDRAKDDYLVYALEQRNGVSTQTIAPDIQRELDKLMECDLLVLNFPIYWFSVPAIMKGWFDRVIVSGLCYGGVRFYDRGGLRGKRVYTAATLGGQPHMFGENAVHGPMNTMLSPLLRGTLGYTGMEVLDPFLAWHVPYISQEAREEMMQDYETSLRGLDSRPSLKFPSLDAFDERLNPLQQGQPA
ncbi:NAD(P)H-dependent oxidoreductase [Aliiroseovarius crassostreae]|uniref:NAD(P)H-dependent oxidoreductase n=1 Tax=Aliiroseovarius crassostreae TaxID=154981 RepID=UPI003C7B2648